eukprot:CAMPEP_0206001648 /NCGR_PEP_ID=MMETSP1464-20131121/2249_1 /ASSEMBLY_ACC=CAM_ASM_001124 /TAXON_ID=119497 /ORGANISM="Exanthemachrysis gayraliae, Strain RCC1523" /LENGTH=54 /DNA_ID=CAMNT_0053374969 /DNA_START=132 /DNA_END=296 /DNA_ORIENTATION=+
MSVMRKDKGGPIRCPGRARASRLAIDASPGRLAACAALLGGRSRRHWDSMRMRG